jgi:Acyltransferase family
LRGLASFSVILTHLARAFDYDLFSPADAENTAPRLLQWPFIRLLPQGRIGVALFALLTGYVCALKPLKILQNGERLTALSVVGKSTIRRPVRLILPAAIALVLEWTVAQFGAFEVAHCSDSEFMRHSAVRRAPTLLRELRHLSDALLRTWTDGQQDYDDHQWALLALLNCSLDIYLALGALLFVRHQQRLFLCILIYLYFWQDPRPDKGRRLMTE